MTAEHETFDSAIGAGSMNKNGIHHLLAARAQEPMTEEILLQMANSMAPLPYPTYSEVGSGLSPRCKDLGY